MKPISKFSLRAFGAAAFLAGVGMLQPAAAAVVTFDDVASSGNPIRSTPITSVGYVFDSPHYHIIDNPTGTLFGGTVENGTQFIGLDSPTLAVAVTQTKSGGGTFSLSSFDGAELWLDDESAAAGGFGNAVLIRVVGSISGGGTITQDFALDGIKDGAGGADDFQHFVFGAGWTNLVSATWDGFQANEQRGSIAFDNISDTAARVPEPSTILLFGAALLGFALRRRA